MHFDILTLFPDLVHSYASESILGRAQKANLISIRAHNFREFSGNKWGHVDDKPYGGGPGMILCAEPIYECLKSIKSIKSKVIVLDPGGKKFDQRMAEKFSKLDRLVLICGRYEGFDARVYKFVDERVSVGDYVLAGGELGALVIAEAVARLIPGVLGNPESLREETFSRNDKLPITNVKSNQKSKIPKLEIGNWKLEIIKEYPQYTRPENFRGLKVPAVLLSGNHKKINEWRKKQQR